MKHLFFMEALVILNSHREALKNTGNKKVLWGGWGAWKTPNRQNYQRSVKPLILSTRCKPTFQLVKIKLNLLW